METYKDIADEMFGEVAGFAVINGILSIIGESYTNAKAHGWWDDKVNIGEKIALMHSELSEALEEFRNGHALNDIYYEQQSDGSLKPCGFMVELADTIIRIADFTGAHECGDVLVRALIEKLKYNVSRPYKHGGKKI